MSDAIPPGPRLPTIPRLPDRGRELESTLPPPDEDVIELMRDVRGACANLGDKITRLETFLLRQELAIVTKEAQIHTLRERANDSERQFRELTERVLQLEIASAAE